VGNKPVYRARRGWKLHKAQCFVFGFGRNQQVSSLEIINEDGEFDRKADMFSKRTVRPKIEITHADTASEALAASLAEKAFVDLEYMENLTGFSREKLISDLHGVIFLNIGHADDQRKAYVTADEYLSGNVRQKLESARTAQAALDDGRYDINVTALEAAQPKDLSASEIAVRLGSTWISQEYVQQFMYELLQTSRRNQDVYQVKYHARNGEWQVTGKKRAAYSDVRATLTYGTERMNAYQIIEETLNLRDARVYDYKTDADGNEKRELNKDETSKAQQAQDKIKQAFKDWIWQDPERRQTLVKL
jgi:N12 class adenine-specific DNA methylase